MSVCRYFVSPSGCQFGVNCNFIHARPDQLLQPESKEPPSNRNMAKCRFYNTPKGCRLGDACSYMHVNPTQATAERAASSTNATPPVERKPRPPVQRPQPKTVADKLESITDPRERAKVIRDYELNQLSIRYPPVKTVVVENGNTISTFAIKPTDPDFPYELEELKVHLLLPLNYPSVRDIKFTVLNNEIPSKLRNAISKNVQKRCITLTETLLELMAWLDKHLESFLIEKEDEPLMKIELVKPEDIVVPPTEDTIESRKEYYGFETDEGEDELEELEELDLEDTSDENEMPSIHNELKNQGTQINLVRPTLKNIGYIRCANISLMTKCERCKEPHEFTHILATDERGVYQSDYCKQCSCLLEVRFRATITHLNSSVVGYLDLNGCTAYYYLLSDFLATCEACGKEQTTGFQRCIAAQSNSQRCRFCHVEMQFMFETVRFYVLNANNSGPLQKKKVKRDKPVVSTKKTTLPNNGTCKHYRKSYRWFRFPCCSKLYPCDICHDEKEDHPIEWANRIVCGFCSKEQPYTRKGCDCGKMFDGKKSSYWNGGRGMRDRTRMSRNDPKKFAGLHKTKANKK